MHAARPDLADDRGFTLVELLVVILIIGILATVALPAFTAQRRRGEDSEAQQMIRTVATALATYQIDEDTYDATLAELEEIEPAIGEAANLEVTGTADGYEITETSRTQTTFTLTRALDGTVTRSCSVPGRGLCRTDSTW